MQVTGPQGILSIGRAHLHNRRTLAVTREAYRQRRQVRVNTPAACAQLARSKVCCHRWLTWPLSPGVYAFWPIMSGPGKGAIGSAIATNDSLTGWIHRGPTIPMPSRINTGYRDPVRAFEYDNKWYAHLACHFQPPGVGLIDLAWPCIRCRENILFRLHPTPRLMDRVGMSALAAGARKKAPSFACSRRPIRIWPTLRTEEAFTQPTSLSARYDIQSLSAVARSQAHLCMSFQTRWTATLSGSPPTSLQT